MIAGAGAEGCFLIPFSLSIELVGIKVNTFYTERERGQWAVYFTSPQSFTITFFIRLLINFEDFN